MTENIRSEAFNARWTALQQSHALRLEKIAATAKVSDEGYFGCSYLISEVRKACPRDTILAVEAVTNAAFVADQIQATIPGSWINCGGGGLGWSGGGALGIKLATDFEHGGRNKGKVEGEVVARSSV